jgi:thiol-disulfide isomerase/thioredoxin
MRNSLVTRAAAVSVATLLTACVTRADVPTIGPAKRPADNAAAVKANLKSDLTAFNAAFNSPRLLTDPAARAKAAPTVLPLMTKVYADFGQLAQVEPEAKEQADGAQSEFTPMMAVFGDAAANARLSAKADSKDPAVAADGRAQQLLVQWWTTSSDPAAQAKVADQVEALAKAHVDSAPLTEQVLEMSQMGAAGPASVARMQALITDVMKNEMVEQSKAQVVAAQTMARLVGKPMLIAGKTIDGKELSTADWRGKVILVDFWATWCGPCKAELPRVKDLYAQYHDKGLEVLGVSSDFDADDLKKFLAADPKMPWPQLFDAAAAEQHDFSPVAKGFGIISIPTMFLIDKAGVCRSVEAREAMEYLVPQLLAEK